MDMYGYALTTDLHTLCENGDYMEEPVISGKARRNININIKCLLFSTNKKSAAYLVNQG